MRSCKPATLSFSDGYTTADVFMQWKNGTHSVHDVDDIDIPQFEITHHETYTHIVKLVTGELALQ